MIIPGESCAQMQRKVKNCRSLATNDEFTRRGLWSVVIDQRLRGQLVGGGGLVGRFLRNRRRLPPARSENAPYLNPAAFVLRA
jgi:hypothetical protein